MVKVTIDIKNSFPLTYKQIYKRLLELAVIDLVDTLTHHISIYRNDVINILFHKDNDETKSIIKNFINNSTKPTKFEYFILYNQLDLTNKYIRTKTGGVLLNDFKIKDMKSPQINNIEIYFSILSVLYKCSYMNRKYKNLKKIIWGEIFYG